MHSLYFLCLPPLTLTHRLQIWCWPIWWHGGLSKAHDSIQSVFTKELCRPLWTFGHSPQHNLQKRVNNQAVDLMIHFWNQQKWNQFHSQLQLCTKSHQLKSTNWQGLWYLHAPSEPSSIPSPPQPKVIHVGLSVDWLQVSILYAICYTSIAPPP